MKMMKMMKIRWKAGVDVTLPVVAVSRDGSEVSVTVSLERVYPDVLRRLIGSFDAKESGELDLPDESLEASGVRFRVDPTDETRAIFVFEALPRPPEPHRAH